MDLAKLSIEDVFTLAVGKGLRPQRWSGTRLQTYNGFTHEQRVRKWQALNLSIEMGLERPATCFSCSICGVSPKVKVISYHSEDYSSLSGHYPLCKSCHSRIHQRFNNPSSWQQYVQRHGLGHEWFFQLETTKANITNQSPSEGVFLMIKDWPEVKKVFGLVASYDFPSFRQITNRRSIADLYPAGKRSGIYILVFADRAFYVGISIDVTNRYVQHYMNHRDIEGISFIPCPEPEQRVREKEIIHHLESSGIRLRNIEHASIPKGESDLDEVVSVDEQNTWLSNPLFEEEGEVRIKDDELYYRYARVFDEFAGLPQAEKTLSFLSRYLEVCIPYSRRTEIIFWALTCLPGSRYKLPYKQPALARMNLGGQEVLTVCRDLLYEGNRFADACIFFLAKSPVEEAYPGGFDEIRQDFDFVHYWGHTYRFGGGDQLCVIVDGIDNAELLLSVPTFRDAIRLFNLRLMKKKPCNWKQNHCMALVDAIYEKTDTKNAMS